MKMFLVYTGLITLNIVLVVCLIWLLVIIQRSLGWVHMGWFCMIVLAIVGFAAISAILSSDDELTGDEMEEERKNLLTLPPFKRDNKTDFWIN